MKNSKEIFQALLEGKVLIHIATKGRVWLQDGTLVSQVGDNKPEPSMYSFASAERWSVEELPVYYYEYLKKHGKALESYIQRTPFMTDEYANYRNFTEQEGFFKVLSSKTTFEDLIK